MRVVTQHVVGGRYASTISGDLRARVAAVAGGTSARSAAGRFGVSVSTAIGWAQRVRIEGDAEARAMGGDRRSRLPEHRAVVAELVARQPDLTLREIRGALAGRGISIGIASLWRFLKTPNITLKKRVSAPPSRTGPT
jgi:transposase